MNEGCFYNEYVSTRQEANITAKAELSVLEISKSYAYQVIRERVTVFHPDRDKALSKVAGPAEFVVKVVLHSERLLDIGPPPLRLSKGVFQSTDYHPYDCEPKYLLGRGITR